MRPALVYRIDDSSSEDRKSAVIYMTGMLAGRGEGRKGMRKEGKRERGRRERGKEMNMHVRRCSTYGSIHEISTFVKVTLANPYKLLKLGEAFKEYQIFESNIGVHDRYYIVGVHSQGTSYCQHKVEVSYDR